MELQFDLLAQNKSHPSLFPYNVYLHIKCVLCGLFCAPYGHTQVQFSEGWIWPFCCMPLGVADTCKKQG